MDKLKEMITYELAKKLKDAGFPKDYTEWNDHDEELLEKTWYMYGKGYSPTLSELIEVCGGTSVFRLTRDTEWEACVDPITGWVSGNGSTPEEAVANLWLELNKK